MRARTNKEISPAKGEVMGAYYGVCGCCNKRQKLRVMAPTGCSACGMPVIPSTRAIKAGYPEHLHKNKNKCERCGARLRIGNEGDHCAPCAQALQKEAGYLPPIEPIRDETSVDTATGDGDRVSVAFHDI